MRMAAPQILQNFQRRRVRRRPRDSAELKPMWRSEGSIGVGIAGRAGRERGRGGRREGEVYI